MPIKKGNDNPKDWESIETDGLKTIKINHDEVNFGQVDSDFEDHDMSEFTETEEVNNTDEVLELTAFSDNMLIPKNNDSDLIIADYDNIDVVAIDEKHKKEAKSFVNRITKFILDFNDVTLTEDHKKYLNEVGSLQLTQLADLLTLQDINKKMLMNIVARVNATQSEDYAILQQYINLQNQHLKLIKEVQNTYRNIPNVIKKMKADILCNQELKDELKDDELITENSGISQFNNSKSLLRELLNKKEREKNEELK